MNKHIGIILLALWLCVPTGYAENVESDVVQVTIHKDRKPKNWSVLPSVWLYGGASGYVPSDYWKMTADGKNKIYNNGIVGGIQAELILRDYASAHKSPDLRVGANIGYRYQQISVHPLIYDQAGVNTHWLSAEVYAGLWLIVIGLRTDFLLKHSINNPDKYTYSGIYDDCFETVVPSVFGGLQFPMPFLRFSMLFGYGFYPTLNTKKLSYYNATKVGFTNSWNIEMRLAIPLFIMSNKNQMSNLGITFFSNNAEKNENKVSLPSVDSITGKQ
ncbi:MAG: hypothetical protein J5704_05765 [Paludibacteraceae bacterium]|nr:hypothetical protein [Paludibacteraceae bacterium]